MSSMVFFCGFIHTSHVKASFNIPENRLNFPTTKAFRKKISMKMVYGNFLYFFTHFNSFLFTIICSG